MNGPRARFARTTPPVISTELRLVLDALDVAGTRAAIDNQPVLAAAYELLGNQITNDSAAVLLEALQ